MTFLSFVSFFGFGKIVFQGRGKKKDQQLVLVMRQ
jgi:hypothetical protein